MTVSQDPSGTMLNAMGINTPNAESKTPEGNEGVSSTEGMFTQAQVDYFIQAAKSEQGRKAKEAQETIDRLQQELNDSKSELGSIQSERDEIKQRMEELTAEDPEKKRLVKLDAELRDQQRRLRADKANVEADRNSLREQLAKGEEGMRKYHIFNVANEYNGGDIAKLTSLCDTLGISGEEQIRTIADSFGWEKKNVEQPRSQLNVPSGHTAGGSATLKQKQISGMSADEIIKNSAELAKMPLTI